MIVTLGSALLVHIIRRRRIRAALFWLDLTPKLECIRYDTREWTAELINVPSGEDGLRWCHEMPVVIHGKTYPKTDCSEQVCHSVSLPGLVCVSAQRLSSAA